MGGKSRNWNCRRKIISIFLMIVLTALSAACGEAGGNVQDGGYAADVESGQADNTGGGREEDQKSDPVKEAGITEGMPGYTVTPEGENREIVPGVQPEVPYWFPAQLLEWDPDEDGELLFHVSTVPLARRLDTAELDTVNPTQNRDTKVMALSIMNSSTSGNSPHGGSTADANVFSYWQYVDTLVYWGGSSGEGLIVPPSADVVDMGHKNGVKVLGTVFMPQTAHGGKMEWLDDLLVREKSGTYPVADKLIEAARVYGFDGWFINQETEGTQQQPLTQEYADRMREFLSYFKKQAPELELIYYDSMTVDGRVNWQNALTDKNAAFLNNQGEPAADGMFLNFWWTENSYADRQLLRASADLAGEYQIDPYDLYAGIDLQARGHLSGINWRLFENPEGGTYTSLGIYCPSWAYFSAESMEDFRKKENVLWVNMAGDPSAETEIKNDIQWRGISTYAVERTAVTSLPFVTNFSMGSGFSFFKNGCRISLQDWNNRSISDILPTYRYIVTNGEGNLLTADLDLEDAYYGGSSLLLGGTMRQGIESVIKLYSADLPVTEHMLFTTTAKGKGAEIELAAVLTFDDGSEAVLTGDQKAGAGWTTITYDLSGLSGKRIRTISYRMTASADAEAAEIHFGNITIAEMQNCPKSMVSDVQVSRSGFDEDGMHAGVCLLWETDVQAQYYEVYRIGQDQTRSLLGVSNTDSFYIDTMPRNAGESHTVFEIVPVNFLLEEGNSGQAGMDWPDNSLPKAAFTADITLAAPGETITFRSLCSQNTQQVKWNFTGADTENAQGETVSVTYSEEGVYPVAITAENEAGSSTACEERYIIITKEAAQGLSLLSQNVSVWADAYVNESEAPEFAVDGDVTKKWCATGNAPHEITLDLGEVMTVSAVDLSHAQAGGESAGMNTKAYTILVSEDGENYTEVWKTTKNTDGTTHDAFAPTAARFVRLVVEQPTQGSDSAARIYEIEVYGLHGINPIRMGDN